MIPLDETELDRLLTFLREAPGRLVAAIVPGSAGGRALVERLREELDQLTFVEADLTVASGELGARAVELGEQGAHVWVLPLDGRHLIESEDEKVAFWQQLNYQRERLAWGSVRTLLLLNTEHEEALAQCADDLWDWLTFFRFPDAMPRHKGEPKCLDNPILAIKDETQSSSSVDLAVLQDQWQRAQLAGLAEQRLVQDYASPLFLALVTASRFKEAERLWERDLRSGEAIMSLPVEEQCAFLGRITLSQHRADWNPKMVRQIHKITHDLLLKLRPLASREPEVFAFDLIATLNSLGNMLNWLGDHKSASRFLKEATEWYRRTKTRPSAHRLLVAVSYNQLGVAARGQGLYDEATEWLQKSLEILEELKIRSGMAASYQILAVLATDQGSFNEAGEWTRKALDIFEELNDRSSISSTYKYLGDVAELLGAVEEAQEWYHKAQEMDAEMVSESRAGTETPG